VSRPARRWDEWSDEDEEQAYTVPSRLALAQPLPAPEPGPRYRPSPEPRPVPRRRVRWGQMAGVALVGYLLIVGASSEVTLLRVNREVGALTAQTASLSTANRVLRQEVGLLHQRRYVDELARTELGYVSPGEVELVPRTAGHRTAARSS